MEELNKDPETQQVPEVNQEPEKATKAEIIEELQVVNGKELEEIDWEEVASLKQKYFNLRKDETEQEKKDFLAAGGTEDEFKASVDESEPLFYSLVTELKEKRTKWVAKKEEQLRENLEKKKAIVEEIEGLASDTDNVNRNFNRFKDLQQEFKNIGDVPQESTTEIWKKFQESVEHYYDQLKVNQELRDYDFKKNLEIKQSLVDKAQELAKQFAKKVEEIVDKAESTVDIAKEEVKTDVVAAFRQLQDLHDQWKLTGPVAKELRDTIWEKFHEATVIINKEYQAHFEERKAVEKANEDAKTALCHLVEGIDTSAFKGAADWEKATREVLAAQASWKEIGYASRKVNNALYTRFRGVCDDFFKKKGEFFQNLKASQAQNLARKTALAEKAEELQDSTDWTKTANELTKLQKEWKEIGPVNRKQSDALWERFHNACDKFFNQRKQNQNATRQEEKGNLQEKMKVIDEMKGLLEQEKSDELVAKIAELQKKWRETGFVPFKDKEKIREAYNEVNAQLRKKFDLSGAQASFEKFESSIDEISGDKSKLQKERDRLFRNLEAKRQDLSTYENNLGFFTSKSKNGDGLVKEVKRKIELIKGDISDLEKKISVIDSKL